MNGNFPAWINGYVHKEIHRLDNWPVLTHTNIDVIKAVLGVLCHCDRKSHTFFCRRKGEANRECKRHREQTQHGVIPVRANAVSKIQL